MIAWPHACSRPEPPRGLHISTTKPAAAWNCASSKNVSPYCVCGPPCTLSDRPGSCSAASKSAGRMIHASISTVPSVRRHGEPLPRRAACRSAGSASAKSVSRRGCSAVASSDEHVGHLVDGADGQRDRAAAASNDLTVIGAGGDRLRARCRRWTAGTGGSGRDPRRCRAACCRRATAAPGCRRSVSKVRSSGAEIQRWSPPAIGTTPTWTFCGNVVGVVVAEERDRRAVGRHRRRRRSCRVCVRSSVPAGRRRRRAARGRGRRRSRGPTCRGAAPT